jgi:hypothetical protein
MKSRKLNVAQLGLMIYVGEIMIHVLLYVREAIYWEFHILRHLHTTFMLLSNRQKYLIC